MRSRCLQSILLCVALVAGACGPDREARSRAKVTDVVLVTLDTTRADVLTPYGADASSTPTPTLARLAAQGVVFELASTPVGLTRPAHASILTGRHPREHGVRTNRAILPAEHATLPALLREAGFQTGAFVSSEILGASSGLLRSFDHAVSPEEGQWSGRRSVAAALAWAGSADADRPLFLWLHLYEPHTPYLRHEGHTPELDAVWAERLPALSWPNLVPIAEEYDGDLPASLVDYGRALYRGEVALADALVGELMKGLEERRVTTAGAGSLWIVTADHGECFGRGIYFAHATCLYAGSERVPLILRAPSLFAPGARVAAPASLLDLVPTALAATGVTPPAGLPGAPLQHIDPAADRPFLLQNVRLSAEATPPGRSGVHAVGGTPVDELARKGQVGVVNRDWKFLRGAGDAEASLLFHRGDERRDLSETHAEVAMEREAALRALLDAIPEAPLAPLDRDRGLRRRLEALGYVE